MKDNQTTPCRGRRAPSVRTGLSAQVLMGLTAEERATLEQVAGLEMRSLSATARMLFLDGLRAYQKATSEA